MPSMPPSKIFRIALLQNVEGREGEDGTGHDDARAGTDGLDDDVLAQSMFALGGARDSDSNDGDGDGGLEYLAHLQAQIGSGGRKEDGHADAPRHRPHVYFGILLVRAHQRIVRLARFQFAECVFRQTGHLFFFLFHSRMFDIVFNKLYTFYWEVKESKKTGGVKIINGINGEECLLAFPSVTGAVS